MSPMTSGVIDVDRTRVLAYRVAASQLDRSVHRADRLDILGLGAQDTPCGSARLALAARLDAITHDDELALIWSVRGAPHLHRAEELPALARALWPMSDADATARIGSGQIKEGSKLGIAAFAATATAMREVVTGKMPKGELSAAVTARVPESLSYDCHSCRSRHISGGVFQQAGILAGVALDPAASSTTLAPVPMGYPVPTATDGVEALVRRYLTLLGPATPAEAARFLGTNAGQGKKAWPAGLAEVRVDGVPMWLPEENVSDLRGAGRPELVRLLPPSDPYLQTRNRDLLLPDVKRQKELWRVLSSPGALVVDGEIVGTWRSRLAGRNRVEVTVTPFGSLAAGTRKALPAEAATVAAARGLDDVALVIAG